MSNELKEPGWIPTEIPGLVRKKGRVTAASAPKPVGNVVSPPPASKITAVLMLDPQPAETTVPPAPAPVEANGVAHPREFTQIQFDPVKAHEDLMCCLIDAKTLVQKLQTAADSYYVMCDYLAAGDAQQYNPIVDSLMRALQAKSPKLVPELIEGQAQQIVEGWLIMAEVTGRAVKICEQLAQTSRAELINEELQKEWNGQAIGQ